MGDELKQAKIWVKPLVMATFETAIKALQENQDEIKILRESLEKYKVALDSVFPFERYQKARPDIKGLEKDKILTHFITHDLENLEIKNFITKTEPQHYLAKKIKACLESDIYPALNIDPKETSIDKDKKIFSKTRSNPVNISKNKRHLFAANHTIYSINNGVVCTWIPKNACSMIRYSFAIANGTIRDEGDISWIHSNNNSFNASDKEMLSAEYTFVILRNPYKRIFSYFYDKLCHCSKAEHFDSSNKTASDLFQLNANSSFNDFIEKLWENPRIMETEEHLASQCDFLVYDNYDDYVPFEKLPSFKKKIEGKCGFELFDTRNFNSINTTNKLKATDSCDNNTTIQEILDLETSGFYPNPRCLFSKKSILRVSTLYYCDLMLYRLRIKESSKELAEWRL